MNIAILGGRFDPPHVWHFWTAQQVLENISGIDQVWLMPDFQNSLKPIVASATDRVQMLHFLETGRIKLSTIAVAKEEITYTFGVVNELKKDVSNRYFWIVGSDTMGEFSRWRDYQKLSRMLEFLVFPRKDYPIKSLPSGFRRLTGNLLLSNISSSLIRDRIKQGKTVSGLVFPEVEEYIRRRNLYK